MSKAIGLDMRRLGEILGIPMLRSVNLDIPLEGVVLVKAEFLITKEQAEQIMDVVAEGRK